ncbi:MAG TPA: hypothetical protein VG838_12130 [Opitutaceae bacterium]|nr:hypothetical protein [Opitutaceae bacterium]
MPAPLKFRPDPRAALLAFALAIAAALPLATTSVTRRDFYFFDVTLTSDTAGITQFFWDLGHGINESDSSAQPLKVEPKPVVYRFMMPPGTFRAFRFDPIEHEARLTVARARIVDSSGRVMRTFQPQDFHPNAQVTTFTAQGETALCVVAPNANDPSLELPLAAPLQLRVLGLMRLRAALPLALGVFAVGLLLASPRVLAWLRTRTSPVVRWLAARPRTAILLTATLAVAVQAHPVIFGGRSFVSPNNGSLMLYGSHPTLPRATQAEFSDTMGSDVGALLFQHLYYPMLERQALRDGELPLWNRYNLGGEPLLGQGQSMAGDPFNLLTILADGAAWAWDLHFLAAHWLLAAGLGLAVWMLVRDLSAAVLTTIGGGFLAYFTFRINHPATFSLGYSPWLLVAWIGLARSRTRRGELGWLGLLLLANWTEFSSGTMKEAGILMACLNLAGVLLVALLPETAGRRGRLLGLAAAAGAIFLLLAAPLWMSFLVALRHSVTAYDVPQAQTYALGQFIGIFDDIFYRQKWTEEWVVAPAGNALFLVGLLAWLLSPSAWRRDRAGLALLIPAVLAGAFAFGIVPAAVIVKIPFIAQIWHVGNTFSCPLLILFAVLAGCGFHEAVRQAGQPGWYRRLAVAALIVSALALGYFASMRGLPKSVFFAGYASTLALAALALPLGLRWTARSGNPAPLCVALALALPVLLWRHGQYLQTQFNHYAFSPGERADFRAPSPAVAWVDQQGAAGPFRVIGLGNNLFPVYNVALRWESLYGVDAVRNGYYLDYAAAAHLGRVWQWGEGTPEESGVALLPVHDMLNVTHYLADHHSPPHAIGRLQLAAQRDLDIYRSASAWPRAFFTDRLATYDRTPELVARVYTGDGRPFAAIQADEHGAPALSRDLSTRAVRPATSYRLTANTTSFVVDAPAPGVAVLTEAYYPGDFRVTIDGQPAAYFRVNHAFKGVAIDRAGRHEIVFRYWPQHFTLALLLAAAGAGLLLGMGGWLWVTTAEKSSIPRPASP